MMHDKAPVNILFISGHSSEIDEIKEFLLGYSDCVLNIQHRPDFFGSGDLLENAGAIDIIILDIDILDLGDFREIFRRMVDMAKGVPIIVYTNHEDRNLALLAMEEGAVDNITKGYAGMDIYKFRDAIEFSLIRNESSRKLSQETARKMRDLRRDADSELHSIRKSNAADMKDQRDQYANLMKEALEKSDKDIINALSDISEALAMAKVENVMLYAQLNKLAT